MLKNSIQFKHVCVLWLFNFFFFFVCFIFRSGQILKLKILFICLLKYYTIMCLFNSGSPYLIANNVWHSRLTKLYFLYIYIYFFFCTTCHVILLYKLLLVLPQPDWLSTQQLFWYLFRVEIIKYLSNCNWLARDRISAKSLRWNEVHRPWTTLHGMGIERGLYLA